MSLFQLKEWWRHHQGGGVEEFDQTSICIANVDNSSRERQKIVTGCFSGVLRVFQPTAAEYSPSHILLEHQLSEPILQVAVGNFTSASPSSLAVLHPRGLAIYQLAQPQAGTDDVPFLELHKLHAHSIPHIAANMVHGKFGCSKGPDAILVQAFDGQIYIFEGGHQVHVTFFDDFLVPGPMLYAPDTDQFITCSSAYELQAYTYSNIIQASQTKAEASDASAGWDLTKRKCPAPAWKVVVGEVAVDLQLLPADGAGKGNIVAVGEHMIMICSQQGEILAQRRLDYHPAAATIYRCCSGPRHDCYHMHAQVLRSVADADLISAMNAAAA
jgi:Bardet-Biedl syndrome 9 protein